MPAESLHDRRQQLPIAWRESKGLPTDPLRSFQESGLLRSAKERRARRQALGMQQKVLTPENAMSLLVAQKIHHSHGATQALCDVSGD